MSNVSVKALKSFTVRNSSTGALTSYAYGQVYSIDSSLASAWAADGLVDNNAGYLIPTGKKNITDATETDVAAYATAQVVDANLTAGNIKKDVKILGVTGTYTGA